MSSEQNAQALQIAHVLCEEYAALGRSLDVQEVTSDPARRKEDLKAVNAAIDKQQTQGEPIAALCLSGGGIRSATFCLGAIQRLAKAGLITKFDYLSTVSGGGYIGSWLKAWAWNESQGRMDAVQAKLAATVDEPKPIRHLRWFSNYLAPKVGVLSADSWALVATYVRNLLLNWLVLVPLLMLPLLAPRLYFSMLEASASTQNQWALFVSAGILLLMAFISSRLSLPSDGRVQLDRRGFLMRCLLPLVGATAGFALWFKYVSVDPAHPGSGGPLDGFSYVSLLGLSLAFFAVAYAVQTWLLREYYTAAPKRKDHEWRAILAAAAAGAASAGLLWAWVQTSASAFSGPVALAVYACLAIPALLGALALGEVFYIGVASYLTTDEDREWWARAGAWDLIATAAWALLTGLALFGPLLIEEFGPIYQAVLGAVGLTAGGVAAKLGQSVLTAAKGKGADAKPSRQVVVLAAYLALAVFIVFLFSFLSFGAGWMLKVVAYWIDLPGLPFDAKHFQVLQATPPGLIVLTAIVLLAISIPMGFFVNVNKFSLHAMYRNRLIRAYLGASRSEKRQPNPFSGFDEGDNLYLKTMKRADEKLVDKPLHIVNIALNLVRGDQLAWQERKAESFTASVLHCGAYDVGYRHTDQYGGKQGMTLGTAVAISGAAFSPNSGYHSSPLLTFVMSLFNVRLGWWLGNPMHASAKEPGPTFAAGPLIAETFGLTDDKNEWVYLSDGGHFDNLGLYEMVVRRCRRIVILDSGADPDYNFDDLGNAIRKIRADLGVPIEYDQPLRIGRLAEKRADGRYCALFRICYSGETGGEPKSTDGKLLYIKPAVHGREPMDVFHYHAMNAAFPHETTADQFFSESQFESYRALGFHQMNEIIGDADIKELEDLFGGALNHLRTADPDSAEAGIRSSAPAKIGTVG